MGLCRIHTERKSEILIAILGFREVNVKFLFVASQQILRLLLENEKLQWEFHFSAPPGCGIKLP